jgi:DNA-3-methyladenine glycosylase
MFGVGGHLYVYFTYGMHYCMNVVTETETVAGAVLLRALEPLEGTELMQTRRGGRGLYELCSGPAKLCEALDVTKKENGTDLVGDCMWIEGDGFSVLQGITNSTRIGLSSGADLLQRFYLSDNQFVSRKTASRRSRPIRSLR